LSGALADAASVDSYHEGRQAIGALVQAVIGLPPKRLHAWWRQAVPALAGRSRSELVADLQVLAPVLGKLGSGAAARDAAAALAEVRRWWR
jgi:hypothetical protein